MPKVKHSTCRHCGQPIRTLGAEWGCEWVHDDPDEDPKDPDYGWFKCYPGKDVEITHAEPVRKGKL